MNRTQGLDKKNAINCLVIMFTPGVVTCYIWHMLHMTQFLNFLLMKVTVWAKHSSASEKFHLAFS